MGFLLLLLIPILPVVLYFTVRAAAREGTLEALKTYDKSKVTFDDNKQ